MKLVTFEVEILPGRFERIGARAHATIIDPTSVAIGHLAGERNLNAAGPRGVVETPTEGIGMSSNKIVRQ